MEDKKNNGNPGTRMVPVPNELQPQTCWYHMIAKFKADATVGLGKIVPGIDIPGMPEASAPDSVELTLDQTLRLVPDEALLKKYARILEDGYNKTLAPGYRLTNTRFSHYEKFEMVAPENAAPASPFELMLAYDGHRIYGTWGPYGCCVRTKATGDMGEPGPRARAAIQETVRLFMDLAAAEASKIQED